MISVKKLYRNNTTIRFTFHSYISSEFHKYLQINEVVHYIKHRFWSRISERVLSCKKSSSDIYFIYHFETSFFAVSGPYLTLNQQK